MGIGFRPFVLTVIASLPASAAETGLHYKCDGDQPDWTLTISGDDAQFSLSPDTAFRVPQRTNAEGREWPKALTLISERDTAIVILNESTCSSATMTGLPIEAFVLTQKGETPVILRGCCTQGDG